MTWLYVPWISSPCAQASADSNLESTSLSDIGERLAAASATWREKPQPPQAWSRRWKQGGFIRLLSGATCEHLTADAGVDMWISSHLGTPARKTQMPESVPGPRESASSPRKSAGSPKSAGLVLSSARTSSGTSMDNLKPSSLHWKRWATALRQEYSVRPKPATPCGASDCSSWPSAKVASGKWERDQNGNVYPTMEGAAATWEAPSVAVTEGSRLTRSGERADELLLTGQAIKASEWMAPVADDTGTRTKCYAQGGTPLSLQTSNWSSPKASDPEKAGPNMRGSKGDVPLPGQAVNWAAPAAQNHKGSSEGSSEGCITRADGKSREDILSYQAEQFFHPPSSPARPIAGGSMSSTDSPNSNQPSVKRKLNPIFVEALIRWPTGLSGFERAEMASIQSPQPTPSSASQSALERWFAIQSAYLQTLLLGLPQGEGQLDMFGDTT